jgi:hypothetical protein
VKITSTIDLTPWKREWEDDTRQDLRQVGQHLRRSPRVQAPLGPLLLWSRVVFQESVGENLSES